MGRTYLSEERPGGGSGGRRREDKKKKKELNRFEKLNVSCYDKFYCFCFIILGAG
jgi:hypothetical protein